ncbi:sensor histidine kinase [Massilia arenosa]|uniref:Sensor histidine kinase n=1 Tax=Zemynaea arenosa TaxID=2561931 RepID=A0A4Y9RTA1_9BURK|nr:histidine kinase [Massilia arenosa]TFW11511.1 sensor histidine kinase [Massilia arenosa]
MIASSFLVLRLAAAWLAIYMVITITIAELFFAGTDVNPGGVIVFGGFALVGAIISIAVSHLGRVRLLASQCNAASLSNRQRRQIEIPFDASDAWSMVDAAIRELPGAHDIESARDSLQVRAKVTHVDPYRHGGDAEGKRRRVRRNQILATITPNGDAGSVTLVCEPERPTWTDAFLVDGGTNLENAEAIVRALTRRVAERRRGEQVSVEKTVMEKELSEARLSLLHAQVEPHFLYNTLASAQLLTRTDPPRADEMLGNLISYLRHSLPRDGQSLSTVGEELERARAYLDILKIRMGSRLNFQIEVPEELMSVLLPPMMLQTLVENAIKHGLEPKTGGGTVWVLARAFDQSVSITVADDGRGFSAEGGGTGIGLRNVRERLRLAFGAAASFAIVANFPSGVAATITVPNSTHPAMKGEVHA